MRRTVGVGEALGTAELRPFAVVFYTLLSLHSSGQNRENWETGSKWTAGSHQRGYDNPRYIVDLSTILASSLASGHAEIDRSRLREQIHYLVREMIDD